MTAVKKVLGYGGSAAIGATQVLITSGGFEQASSISYLNMISTPPSVPAPGSSGAVRVQHASGTNAYTGDLSFDVHQAALALFSPTGGLLQRYYAFDVGIQAGANDLGYSGTIQEDWKMTGCKLTSLSLAGAAGGLVTAQLSFMALAGKALGTTPNAFIRDSAEPLGYWYTGTANGEDVKDWNLSMSQDAEFVYKNVDTVEPAYIKIGLVSYTLTVNSYQNLFPAGTSAAITIATDTFTLTGRPNSRGFSFGGVSDVGTYSYAFETSSQTGKSDALVIS